MLLQCAAPSAPALAYRMDPSPAAAPTVREDFSGALLPGRETAGLFLILGQMMTGTLEASDGSSYTVRVSYNTEAQIPKDTQLQVTEIPEGGRIYEEYLKKTINAIGESRMALSYVRFFDISLLCGGAEFEPQAPVNVEIELLDKESGGVVENTTLIHFAEDAETENGESVNAEVLEIGEAAEPGIVRFAADGFSVFGVVYTTDFAWQVDGQTYELSFPEEGTFSFAHLAEALGLADRSPEKGSGQPSVRRHIPRGAEEAEISENTRRFVEDIESITSSSPDLLSVSRTEEENTAESSDWLLLKTGILDGTATLTVALRTGEQFEIQAVEGANPFGLDGQTYTIWGLGGGTAYGMRNETASGNARALASTTNASQAAAWTFEYTGEGKQYLIHDGNGHYLRIDSRNAGGISLVDRETALANPILVHSKEGKYSFTDVTGTNGLNIYSNSYVFGSWEYSTTDPNFMLTLQSAENPSMPGTIVTADTSGLLTINLFDYGPEDQLDREANNNSNPANAGVNVNHALKFFSYGKNVGTGINDFTGNSSVRPGIVADRLGDDGFPYLDTANSEVNSPESLGYLFGGTAHNGVTPYNGLNHLFTLDDDGYYHYDSNDNYAYYNSAGGNKDFTVYSKTFPEEGADDKFFGVGFFPFDEYNEYYNCIHGKNGFEYWNPHTNGTDKAGHYNHHFGMSLSGTFVMPPDGQYNGKDVTYEFSGDDDMWVFIDGVLILDVGGIHNPAHGSINFTTGVVTVNGEEQTGLKDKYKQVTGKDWDDSAFSQHDFRVFYMERGGMYSNLELTYNLPLTQKTETGDIEFDKVSMDEASLKLEGAEFTLYTEYADGVCSSPLTLGGTVVSAVSDGNGHVSFRNVPYGTYYMKETVYPAGYEAKDPEEIFVVTVGEGGTVIRRLGDEPGAAPVSVITNKKKKTNVEVIKQWENGTPPAGASVEIVLGRYRLTEDPEGPGTGTLVIHDSYTGLPHQTSYQVTYTVTGPGGYSRTIRRVFTEQDREIAETISDVPAGVSYTVTKQVEGIPHYSIANDSDTKTVAAVKNDTAEATLNNSTFARNAYRVRVYAVNNQNMSTLELYSDQYYPAGSALSIRLEHNAYNWGFFSFTVSSNTGWNSDTFSRDGSRQFTGSLNADTDLYVRCSDSRWTNGYDWIKEPTVTGADPIASGGGVPTTRSAAGRPLRVTPGAPNLPDPPAGLIYQIDSDYAQNPDKIILSSDPWTGSANGLDAWNENGAYVYYIAEVNETGMPSGTTVTVAGDVTLDGSVKVLTVTNTLPDLGSLKIKKTIVGADLEDFTAEQKALITFTVTGPDGYERTFTLADLDENGEILIPDLKPGTYTVTEMRPDPSTPEGFVFVSTVYSVLNGQTEVVKDGTAEVLVTNTYRKVTDIIVEKVDQENLGAEDPAPLAGASFTLTRYTDSTFRSVDQESPWSMSLEDVRNPDGSYKLNGHFVFTDVPEGFYRLHEDVLPAGYVSAGEDPAFEIRRNPETEALEIILYRKAGNRFEEVQTETGTWENLRIGAATTLLVGNTPGSELPRTGGPGTAFLFGPGFLLTAGAGAGLLIRRKKRRGGTE